MILKASQRAGGKQLAVHLLRMDDNDHIDVHEIRGFAASDITGALREAYAVSLGTRCKQYLFSVSLNPPPTEDVPMSAFKLAIEKIEERCGLSGQPRVIVAHEKEGRRHVHCVWSRIRAKEMKAVNLPTFKFKLQDISRELYLRYGWDMPRGYIKTTERNPLNCTRAEWQQAQRAGRNAKQVKQIFQDSWAISDSLPALKNALEARGYFLAQGDRRALVALDHEGEIYALARWIGIQTKKVNDRLGDVSKLPTVNELKKQLREKVEAKLDQFRGEIRAEFEDARSGILAKKRALVTWQRDERKALEEMQKARAIQEANVRAARFRKGLKGLWDWITGKRATIEQQNEAEWLTAQSRDEAERHTLIQRQLGERRALKEQIKVHAEKRDTHLSELKPSRKLELDSVTIKPRQQREVRRRHRRSLSP